MLFPSPALTKSVQQEFRESAGVPENAGKPLPRTQLSKPAGFYLFLCCVADGSVPFSPFFCPAPQPFQRPGPVLACALILPLKSQ